MKIRWEQIEIDRFIELDRFGELRNTAHLKTSLNIITEYPNSALTLTLCPSNHWTLYLAAPHWTLCISNPNSFSFLRIPSANPFSEKRKIQVCGSRNGHCGEHLSHQPGAMLRQYLLQERDHGKIPQQMSEKDLEDAGRRKDQDYEKRFGRKIRNKVTQNIWKILR